VPIELAGDLPRRSADRRRLEDAPNDGSLGVVDRQHARLARYRPIAVRAPARVAAVADDALHAPPDLVLQVRQDSVETSPRMPTWMASARPSWPAMISTPTNASRLWMPARSS